MFQTKHISNMILKTNLINLVLGFLFVLIYWIALLIGVDFQSRRSLFFGLVSIGIAFIGVFISVLAGAAIAENLFRRRFGDYQFVCLNRFGSSHSFFWSQLLMTILLGGGICSIFSGTLLLFRIVAK